MSEAEYLLADQAGEIERLTLQSQVWGPAGADLLRRLPARPGLRALDVGCGPHGWLALLSDWAGTTGQVVGTDVADAALDAANAHACRAHLANVSLVRDDLFATALDPASFDLVHARFMLAPLGRANEQLAAYRGLLKPRGWLILEEPDSATWRHDPPAPAAHRLTGLVRRAFRDGGGNFDAGTELIELADGALLNTTLRARTLTLPPGHPYALAPLFLADSLRDRLRLLADPGDLQRLHAAARDELAHPRRWTITFTLMQLYGRTAGSGRAR